MLSPVQWARSGIAWAWKNKRLIAKGLLVAAVAAAALSSPGSSTLPQKFDRCHNSHPYYPLHLFPPRSNKDFSPPIQLPNNTCYWLLEHGAHYYGDPTGVLEKLKKLDETPEVAELILKLETSLSENYPQQAGYHSLQSPVLGSRSDESQLISQAVLQNDFLDRAESRIYQQENYAIIPLEKRIEAEKRSQEIFREYISKYSSADITEENVIAWTPLDKNYALTRTETPVHSYTTQIFSSDATAEGHNIILGKFYLPTGVVAYHELMHVELRNPCDRNHYYNPASELMTMSKSIMLLDQIYKEIHGIPLGQEIDYNIPLPDSYSPFGNLPFPAGKFANFYRQLEASCGNLAKALVSDESIRFLKEIFNQNQSPN